jgi:hypothetical protein
MDLMRLSVRSEPHTGRVRRKVQQTYSPPATMRFQHLRGGKATDRTGRSPNRLQPTTSRHSRLSLRNAIPPSILATETPQRWMSQDLPVLRAISLQIHR